MKKCILWLMVLALMLACCPAVAQTPAVDEKFAGQTAKYAVKGTVTFSAEGQETKLMDTGLFQMLKEYLPGLTLSFGHSMYEKVYPGGYVRFTHRDGNEGEVLFAYDDDVIALGGASVSDDDTWYLAETDAVKILRLFSETEDAKDRLPGIDEIVRAVRNADPAWQEKAKQRLSNYETELSIWMNQYAAAQMGQDEDGLYSELCCTIPFDAVKGEIRGLLGKLYGDQETLALLSEVLSPIGADIYLNPAMEPLLSMLVDQIRLDGEVEVLRRFDARGEMQVDSITLPLPAYEKWQHIQVETGALKGFVLKMESDAGEKMHLSVGPETAEGYAGSFLYEDGEKETHIGFDFTAAWHVMEETYSLQTDKVERLKQGVLTLTPDQETALPGQRITLDLSYSSASDERAVASLKADLVWTDLESGAVLAAQMNAKAANRFEVKKIGDLQHILYFSDVPAAQRTALISHILLAPFEGMWAEAPVQE